ncbi:MAG: NMD3 family protein [Methanobrevibacter sp. CfCl-M3]
MFCYLCGKSEILVDGLCRDCYLKQHHILTVPSNISVKICAHCNAKFFDGKWIDANLIQEEIIYRAIEDSIIIDPSSENPVIDMNIIQMRGTIAESVVEAMDVVFGVEVYETHDIDVRLIKGVCPTCSKRNSNYYEAVIQLRSQMKRIGGEKKDEVDVFIYKYLDKLYLKDKLAYVSQRVEIKEGMDYYIGSLKSCRKLASAIQESFGGVITESERLVTKNRDTGKDIFRFWIAIRLPGFSIGDFIEFEDKIAKILSFDRKKVFALDLNDNTVINIFWNKLGNIKVLKSRSDIQKASVISKSPTILQVLDPKTYEVVDFPISQDIENYSIGDEVDTISINGGLYIV